MRRFLVVTLLVVLALGGGFFLYQRNIVAVPVTAIDLEKGGSYSSDERASFKASCLARVKSDAEAVCGCLNEKMGTELSRFDRLLVTASFQEKLSDIVGLTKGLVQSGVPAEKVKTAEDAGRVRMKEMLKVCKVE